MTTEPAAAADVTALLPVAAGHTLITGPSGSGRSRAMEMLWDIEHADPTISSWVCDPTGIQDPAVAARHERYAAGHQASVELLAEARSLVEARVAAVSDQQDPFEPAEQSPLVSLSVDDAHLLLEDPQAMTSALWIASLGRSVRVVLRVASTGSGITAMRSERLVKQLTRRPPLALQRRTV